MMILFFSCGVPQKEFDLLKEENERLNIELAECQLNPSQIFAQASELYNGLEFSKSKDKLVLLIKKYPNSRETKRGKRLLKKVQKEILKTNRSKKKEEKEDSSDDALSMMSKKYDVAKEVIWYTDKSSRKFYNEDSFYIYIGKKEGKKPWLGLSINNFSKSRKWLFIRKITINIDGAIYILDEENPGDFKAKEEIDGYREWFDRILKSDDIDMIRGIATGKVIKVELIGKKRTVKRTLTTQQKKAVQNVINAYNVLK